MKILQAFSISLLMVILVSCMGRSGAGAASDEVDVLDPRVDLNQIESNFGRWWTYHYRKISLSSDFVGIDELSDTVGKMRFLEKLGTGKYIPLRLKSSSNSEIYKLYKLGSSADKRIGETISSESKTNLKHFKMEGLPFPQFDFVDIEGNRYTSQNTKGKTLIVKTWFIGCKACVTEFPELNELVDKYKDRKDVLFLSLATDQQEELEQFLKKKHFDYQVVADQDGFIGEKLSLRTFPTHLVIDQNGNIVKVVNKASEMMSFLEQKVEKSEKRLAESATVKQ